MNPENVHNLPPRPLGVAVSSRALFDLEASHAVFEARGIDAYRAYQLAREDQPLKPGEAYPLVRKLLRLNSDEVDHAGVEVILVSRNSADTGLRIFNTIETLGLPIERAVFTNGEAPHRYMAAMQADLFLSTHDSDVRRTLDAGYAAAKVLPGASQQPGDGPLRIAFDGDAVLFSDEAERLYQAEGLEAFADSERRAAQTPLGSGPFRRVLQALHDMQSAYPVEDNPIRTALVTARSAPAHKRVILTLRAWGIRIDEALFLGGKPKGPFLAAFGADIFFDDHPRDVASARDVVPTGHVPAGVTNAGDG